MNPREHEILRIAWAGALLALAGLAAAGCGGDDAPADAMNPDLPDACRVNSDPCGATDAAPIDAPPIDAPRIDAAPIDAAPIDAMLGFSCGELPDSHEPNDTAGTAPTLPPETYSGSPLIVGWYITACLSDGNEDWYELAASSVDWDDGGINMSIRLFTQNTDYCDGVAICDGEQLPSVPENTVTIELYRASNMELLSTTTSEFGVIRVDGGGSAFEEDFLVRVHGPAQALYDYRLSISLTTIDGEDECEC